jgi:hypothetical protein
MFGMIERGRLKVVPFIPDIILITNQEKHLCNLNMSIGSS